MKSLEKDRSRRYETANGFAADVQRYLNDEPVQACPPSAAVSTCGSSPAETGPHSARPRLLTAMLVVGTVVSTWLASRAARAERDAVAGWAEESRQRQEFERQRDRAVALEKLARSNEQKAKKSASEARSVLEFFVEKVLAAARPENQKGGLGIDASIRAAVDAAEPQVAVAFRDQPLVEASIRNALGESYRYLGEPALAIRQHERAPTTAFGPTRPEPPRHAHQHEQPRPGVQGCRQSRPGPAALRTDVGEAQGNTRPRPSRHAHQHEQPRHGATGPRANSSGPCGSSKRRWRSGRRSSSPITPKRSSA